MLVLKIESAKRMLQLTGKELNKKEILDTIKNNEDYAILKNKIEELLINNILNPK